MQGCDTTTRTSSTAFPYREIGSHRARDRKPGLAVCLVFQIPPSHRAPAYPKKNKKKLSSALEALVKGAIQSIEVLGRAKSEGNGIIRPSSGAREVDGQRGCKGNRRCGGQVID